MRHHAVTHERLEQNPEVLLAVPYSELIAVLPLCGAFTVRDVDNIAKRYLETIAGNALIASRFSKRSEIWVLL